MFEHFLANFVNKCISNGKATPEEICNEAAQNIKILQDKINKIESYRTLQANYRMLIRRLGGEIKRPARQRDHSINLSDFSIPEEKLPAQIRSSCVQVCDYIEKQKRATVREILDNVVSSIDKSTPVYIAIDWLVEHDILIREQDTIERIVSLGPEWASRPYEQN